MKTSDDFSPASPRSRLRPMSEAMSSPIQGKPVDKAAYVKPPSTKSKPGLSDAACAKARH